MTTSRSGARQPQHRRAFVAALVFAGALPLLVIVVSIFVEISATGFYVIFAFGLVVSTLLLARWGVLYRRVRRDH
jgi:hypothetical protein